MTEQEQKIIAAARACLGTPFCHQGRTPGVALDCIGLLVVVGRSLGLSVRDSADYAPLPSGDRLGRSLLDHDLRPSPAPEPLPGQVMLLRLGRMPQHVAIATDGGMIHAYQGIGRVAEHHIDATWRNRLVRLYDFPIMAGGH